MGLPGGLGVRMTLELAPRAEVTTGPIVAKRGELAAILREAGIATLEVPEGRFAAPVAILEPGEPFIAPATLGAGWRRVRWRIVLAVGRTDAHAVAELMARLVERVVLAIDAAPGWTMPTVSGPRMLRVVGVDQAYISAELMAESIIALRET